MQFYVVDLSGRHLLYENATSSTIILDVKKFAGVKLGVTKLSQIHLIYNGTLCSDQDQTLISLGLSEENQNSFRLYAVIKPELPDFLFDGDVHPFIINDFSTGGKSSMELIDPSFEVFMSEVSVGEFNSLQREIDDDVVRRLEQLERDQLVSLPICVKEFLSQKNISELCCQHLAMGPMVLTGPVDHLDAPMYQDLPNNRAALMFMMDHQGCCFWYAVWDKQTQPQTCEVHVLVGGQDISQLYPTSRNFWGFLCDYARKSRA